MPVNFLSGVWRALLAGLVAGAVSTMTSVFLTLPLIAMGEQLEQQLSTAPNLLAMARFSGTMVANLASAVSLSLWLFAILYMLDLRITLKNAFPWVVCFWLAVFFIPAISLPATLPGMGEHHEHHELLSRQFVWLGLVLSSGVGLLLHTGFFIDRLARPLRLALSILLLTLPSLVVGMLLPMDMAPSPLPPRLVQLFVMYSLLSGFILSASIIMVFAISPKK
ncbi:MAG: CbtA family protein [Hydrotalea sp.]|nr:CbtA family protein [Hydrotalea sp.]